jgi:ATP-dependent exoDNAse (exonuclease V) alpha subunit
VVSKEHPYASWNEMYRKFQRTTYDLPAYAVDCVPFRWVLREHAVELSELYQLPYQVELEDAVDKEANLNNPIWVQHADNQKLLLDTFFSAVEPERTLLFIYAKESPVSDDPRRILIGVGRALSIGQAVPYVQTGDGFGSVLWERVITHSIRPTMTDGFLLPYHELLTGADDGGYDPADLAVFVPEEFGLQFSYASEHVSHDAALALILALDRAVDRISPLVSGSWAPVRSWLSERLAEVWQARGPCPGLGAALSAFGIPEGVLLAHAAQRRLADNEDPWPLIDQWMRDPSKDPEAEARIGTTMSKTWSAIPESRRELLRLLSRFDLTIDQATRMYQETERAKAGIGLSDADIGANPYVLYEADRFSLDPVAVSTIDRGVFPTEQIRTKHPLPPSSRVDESVDPRRVRALVVDDLENAATAGDSLRPQGRVIQDIRDQPLDPVCPLGLDVMAVCAEALPPEIVTVSMANGEPAYQLARLHDARRVIARQVERRRKGASLKIEADWRSVIDAQLGAPPADDDGDEELARQEKAAALEVLATSRVSVLIGAAGTGKTTLLRALSTLPGVSEGGLLLLAPTGKARVRMQAAIGHQAMTLAQLLVRLDRYDGDTGRYHRSDHDRANTARTIIVDECSMLTEEALDALLDGIEGFDRLILVGDPRQLPPIGVGRPFVDIIEHVRGHCGTLSFPRVGPSYAELTIPRRQVALGEHEERADLLLAEWFAGGEPSPGADEVWDRVVRGDDLGAIAMRQWNTPGELHELLRTEIASATPVMSGPDDAHGFQRSYGGDASGDFVYFNLGSASSVESWQVLSPVRGEGAGVNELNRMLHRTYRAATLDVARNPQYERKVTKPAGPEEIVYGDKVINIRNKTRRHYFPSIDDCLEYVANGEIGVVTGPFRKRGARKPPFDRINVAFSTQPGTAYTYFLSELGGDDSTPILELAYAITIHKSQGSEFGKTFVVIPNPCRLLSRELVYTALTRQREHVVLLHQGDPTDLRRLSSAVYSETAARLTNLFTDPEPVEVDGRFLEAGLIHRTRKGIAVRSRSEVIIADLLFAKGIDFEYERPLTVADGSWRSPDFTIEDDTTGTTIYWEHLGMLQRPSYRRKWEQKLAWYRANKIVPHAEGGGPAGTLVTTEDGDDGSISSADIEALVDDLLG